MSCNVEDGKQQWGRRLLLLLIIIQTCSDFFLICHDKNSHSTLFNYFFKVMLTNKLTSLGANFKADVSSRPPIKEFSERITERAGNRSSICSTGRAGNLNPEKKEIETATTFVDKYNGCPVIKFQIVNEWSNSEGGEIVDCQMKVVGVKYKKDPVNGKVTQSQYVRVQLVSYEHPFLSRVWHGVHILDSSSPLLTDMARQRIEVNGGSWPSNWFDPDIIRSKLDFRDLIVTVIGLSNVSAMAVHAYKRYQIGDVLIGFNFAPIVFRDIESGLLEVDFDMANDVREQLGLRCENLSMRRSESKENVLQNPLAHRTRNLQKASVRSLSSSTTIRWKRSRMLTIGSSIGGGSSFFGESAVGSTLASVTSLVEPLEVPSDSTQREVLTKGA